MSDQTKSLKHLFQHIPIKFRGVVPDVDINGISYDSRLVKPGNLFVAIKGGTVDRHQYIQDVISRGAVAIVGTNEIDKLQIPYIRVINSRQTLAQLAAYQAQTIQPV